MPLDQATRRLPEGAWPLRGGSGWVVGRGNLWLAPQPGGGSGSMPWMCLS